MVKGNVAHALESVKISAVFLRHAKLAAKQMANYREMKNRANNNRLRGDVHGAALAMVSANAHRRMAYDIMFPYRQEFKFRAWCLNEATAETQIALVYGEC